MRVSKGKSPYIVCVITVLLLVGGAFRYTSSSSEPMLPEGLIIEDIFKPGHGSPVGTVLLVQGKVVIMHKDMVRGYWAKKDLPLFKGDTIITQEKGRIRFELIDGSVMTLSSRTNLVINRSVYDRVKKSRFSFLKMTLGKARFWTKKLLDLKHSEFKVKTHTLVVGVRGSDFIIRATPKLTEVTALEKTELEVVSLAFPEAKPMVVTDFGRTIVEEGALPTEVEMVAPEEIEQMKEELTVTPERAEPEGKVEVGQEKAEKKEGEGEKDEGEEEGEGEEDEEGQEGDEGQSGDDEDQGGDDDGNKAIDEEDDDSNSAEGAGTETAEEGSVEGALVEEVPTEEGIGEQIPIFVPDEELVMPEDPFVTEEFEEHVVPDIFDIEELSGQEGAVMEQQEEEVIEQQEEISEEQHEEAITEKPTELPSFPGAP